MLISLLPLFVTFLANGFCKAEKNVLLVIVDDLRPEIGIYARENNKYFKGIKTPHIDALASESFVAKNAFVQQSVCGPSRASFLTSRRPETTRIYENGHNFLTTGGDFTTLPQFFKEHGYLTAGMGKIFHSAHDKEIHARAWTEVHFNPKVENDRNSWTATSNRNLQVDEQIAEHAVETLKSFTNYTNKPFMVVVGFHKPHLSWDFPSSQLDKYSLSSIRAPKNAFAPKNMPDIAWNAWAELREKNDIASTGCTGTINDTLQENLVKVLRRAYYSCVSYIDELIGDIIGTLKDTNVADNTIVALVSDHGYLLGEHGAWCKHSNFELAVKSPFIIRIPGLTDHGIVTDQLVEMVDLYPTLVEAAGLGHMDPCPEDSTHTKVCREGSSVLPLITHPHTDWKDAAFTWQPRYESHGAITMGYAVFTQKYHYAEWVAFDKNTFTPDWSNVYGRELYDLEQDPGENTNVVDDEIYSDVAENLSQRLHLGWRAALPR